MQRRYCGEAAGRHPIRGVLVPMRLSGLLFTAILVGAPAWAQQPPPSSAPDSPSATQDAKTAKDMKEGESNLPVSLDKIREGLQQTPAISLRTLDERPIFRLQ